MDYDPFTNYLGLYFVSMVVTAIFVLVFPKSVTVVFYVAGILQIRIMVYFFRLHCSDLKILLRLWQHFNDCWRKADTVYAKNSEYRMYMQDILYSISFCEWPI